LRLVRNSRLSNAHSWQRKGSHRAGHVLVKYEAEYMGRHGDDTPRR